VSELVPAPQHSAWLLAAGWGMSSSISSSSLVEEAHAKAVRPWLDLIDSLRSVGVEEEVDLPQIAVMGDQSSGKSSVLEALSGVQFPRGSGLVTRCPVLLVMKRSPKGSPWKAKAKIAWHRQGVPQPAAAGEVNSPEMLAKVMSILMDAACESSQSGFSSDSVQVELESPDCPDLTLIDLPGIVRTAVSGQSTGVIAEVNGLIDSHLGQERTIILAIVPSNQDVATVDILERAKRVDPKGERTIGVLTKPDLIGPGNEEEVMAVLENRRKPLALGYVMVRNRTQKELSAGISLEGAHKVEYEFFSQHEVFSKVDSKMLGVSSLTDRCVQLLVRRIRISLPFIKWELQEHLASVEKDLRPFASRIPRTYPDQLRSLMQIVAEFSRLLRASIAGEYRDPLLNSTPELRIRSRVDRTFRALQSDISGLNPGFEHPDFPRLLQEQLRAHRGRELCGIVNSQFFYIFMLEQVEKFRPIIERCRADCCNIVHGVAHELIEGVSPQYPGLKETISAIVNDEVSEAGEGLQPELDSLFDKEKNPFTENADLSEAINRVRFERFDRVLHQVLLEAGDKPATNQPPAAPEESAPSAPLYGSKKGLEQLHEWVSINLGQWYRYSHGANPTSKVEDMSTILQAYWHVTSKRLCDNACMLMETSFLSAVTDSLEARLLALAQNLDEKGVAQAFQEDRLLAERREMLESRQKRIRAALDEMNLRAPDVVATSRRSAEDGASISSSFKVAGSIPAHQVALYKEPKGFDASALTQKSAPERKADSSREGALAEFTFAPVNSGHPCLDQGGLLYWIGTERHARPQYENPHDRGLALITSSGMSCGEERLIAERHSSPVECATTDQPESWICIDIGVRLSLCPTHYVLRNGCSTPGADLVNWVLEGYHETIRMWVILEHRHGPHSLPSPFAEGAWELKKSDKAFRFFRVRSTGENGLTGLGLPVGAIELYGKLFSKSELF
jgi:interferon-induced GTP-binding protein Mx1